MSFLPARLLTLKFRGIFRCLFIQPARQLIHVM